MAIGFASRPAVAAVLLCLSALAHAQPTPAASAPDATRQQSACEKTSFDVRGTIDALVGAKVPPQGVVVRILLQFDDPKAEPAVTVTFNSGDQAFADAVVAEAKKYRFDCAKQGDAPLRYVQEIQFVGADATKPVAGVIRPAVEKGTIARNSGCFVSADGNPRAPSPPPWASMVTGSQIGQPSLAVTEPRVIIVKLIFSAPDAAPQASILFSRAEKRFEAAVLDYVAEHRWSCMKKGDPPVDTTQEFKYGFEREPAATPLTMQQFLSAVDKITEQKVRFDFTTMGCPFKLRLNYTRPFLPNTIEEIGQPDPNRREFVEWLRQVTVKPELNPDNKLVDRDFEVSVPCLVLDLL